MDEYWINHGDIKKSKENFLTQLPVVSAAKLGLMDVMEVLAQMGVNFDQTYSGRYKRRLPLIFAFEAKKFEVVDFILSKMRTPLLDFDKVFGLNVFHCAVEHGHLDLVKRMLTMRNKFNEPWYDTRAVWLAILHGQIQVLKHLTPHLNQFNIEYGIMYAMSGNATKLIDALKVLLPHANDRTMKSVYRSKFSTNKEMLNMIAEELKIRNI